MNCPVCNANLSRDDDEHPCGVYAEMFADLNAELTALKAKVERYRAAMKAAYDAAWHTSDVAAILGAALSTEVNDGTV